MARVLSLYDYTTFMLQPWFEAGHTCCAIDILHPSEGRFESHPSGGTLECLALDLQNDAVLESVFNWRPDIIFSFPVCTELSYAGTRHWKEKSENNPYFQLNAAKPAIQISDLANAADIPFFIENPRSALSQIWRPADYEFSPHEYGGYLSEDDINPLAPGLIAGRDAYKKTTKLWTNSLFRMPEPRPVTPLVFDSAQGVVSNQFIKLGGKSTRTKMIRSATPRGFARAVYLSHKDQFE